MKYNLINDNFYSNYVENLLKARGVQNFEDYLNPNINYLNSPLKLKNIQKAGVLYTRVVKANGRILIVVDSDNDGYTSAAIIYQYTQRMNTNCQIDYWLHEGKQHGLQDHIDKLMNEHCQYDLIILPDSSSSDANYHDMLDEIHIPCLILDHHLTDVAFSDNAVVVNNQTSPDYPNKELTGAGIVLQFCRYIDSIEHHDWAFDYVDLAAWGIIGDMGSMIDMENRYICKYGLSHINNDFFHCLLERQAYSITGQMGATWHDILAKVNPISVAFYIVPLVNALIRIGTMEEKDLLFTAFIDGGRMVPCNKRGAKGTLERADVEATRVCTNAKAHQQKLREEIVAKMEHKIVKYDLLENKILFIRLDSEDKFPSELNGLIAMQLATKYKKPTIIARLNDQGYDRGSARGLSDSALKDFKAFLAESQLFEYTQGHANAFGVSILDANLDSFHQYANEQLKDIDFGENVYDVNFVRSAASSDLSELITALGQASDLWGQNNSEPLIYITDLYINASDIRIMGQNRDTVKIESNGVAFLKFKATDFIDEIKQQTGTIKLELVCRANLNEWGGRVTPQLFIDNYEIKHETILDF